MSRIVLEGTVRSRTPEATWTALEPELDDLGITRVARLTGLDYIGIPVWTAIRPHSHTLVTTQGKGADDTLAKSRPSWKARNCGSSNSRCPWPSTASTVTSTWPTPCRRCRCG